MMFSIVMPTYNYAEAIGKAIRSVIEQTCGRWELIVVDDGSTDGTAGVAESFGDQRVRVIRRAERTGRPGPLRNVGAAAARGEIVCYLDHDDRWASGHLAALAAAYADPRVRVVATGCRRVAPDGRVLGGTVPVNLAWHPELQIVSPIFEPSRVSHRQEVLAAAGGWANDQVGLEDWDLWVRLADRGESFTLLPQRSVDCTLHPESRRHSLEHRYLLTFGPPVDAGTADAVLAAVQRPEARSELGRRYRADVIAWYQAMAVTGELRLADGVTVEQMLGLLRADLAGDPPFLPHIRPCGDAYVLCRVLACQTRSHAERVVAVNRRRMTRSSAYLQELIAHHLEARGALTGGAQASGAQASGAQASGAQASGAQASGAQARGAQAGGVPAEVAVPT
jgi:glycosyltransferase involved in cell wall biosynthesis